MNTSFGKFLILFVVINSFAATSFAWVGGNDFSNEIGVTASSYKYKEENIRGISNFMTYKATNIGLEYVGTAALDRDWFLRGELMGSYSINGEYSSDKSGTISGMPNWYIDTKGLFGRSFIFDNYVLAPYIGIGMRYLRNDADGYTSDRGKSGYLRESNYCYLPVGAIYELGLGEESSLLVIAELDYMFLGKQNSGSRTNTQDFGYGARLSLMYQWSNWSIGPYLRYWNIDDSDSVGYYGYGCDSVTEQCGIGNWAYQEPKNYTIESGIKLSYRF